MNPVEPIPLEGSESLRTVQDTLGFLQKLWALDQCMRGISKVLQRRLGVTGQQHLIVCLLGESPGITSGQVAATLHMHPSTLAGLTRRLERQGLLRRRGDGRRAVYHLTAGGRRINNEQAGTVEEILRQMLLGLPPEKVESTKEVLASLAGELQRAADLE